MDAATRNQVTADLDAIDAALTRLRATSTAAVGTAFGTASQRLHDAFALALKAGIGSGELGSHRGIAASR